MTQNERDEAIRDGLLQAATLVLRYQKENGRQLGVNEVCRSIIKRLTQEATLTVTWTERQSQEMGEVIRFPAPPAASADRR